MHTAAGTLVRSAVELLPSCRVAAGMLVSCSPLAACCGPVAGSVAALLDSFGSLLLALLFPCCSRVAPLLLPCCSPVADPIAALSATAPLRPCCSPIAGPVARPVAGTAAGPVAGHVVPLLQILLRAFCSLVAALLRP